MPGSGGLVGGASVGVRVGRRKRKNYYIAYTLDDAGVYVGLETHLTTGTVCMLTTVVVGDVCEGRQHVTRAVVARLLCVFRASAAHRLVKVRGKDWVR